MKKAWKSLVLTGILSLSLSVPAFAGSWQLDTNGYWYQNDDGSHPTSSWQWIDGNNDGIAENYYFDSDGYLLVSTTTPDGSTVDANGARTINGIVQTQTAASSSPLTQPQTNITATTPAAVSQEGTSSSSTKSQNSSSSDTQSSVSQSSTVWISATGKKYHRINNCGKMNPSKAKSMSLDEAIRRGYDACSKCY